MQLRVQGDNRAVPVCNRMLPGRMRCDPIDDPFHHGQQPSLVVVETGRPLQRGCGRLDHSYLAGTEAGSAALPPPPSRELGVVDRPADAGTLIEPSLHRLRHRSPVDHYAGTWLALRVLGIELLPDLIPNTRAGP